MTLRRRFSLWAPVVLWAGVIFGLSAIPSLSSGLGTWDEVLRKAAHMTEYAILGALLLRATRRPGIALGLAALYAISDEVHQHFVEGRHAAALDVLIDATGALVGVLAWRWLSRRREAR